VADAPAAPAAGRELGCWGLGGALPSEAVICCCADMSEPGVCSAVFFILTIIAVRYRTFNDYSLFINHSLVVVRGFGVWGKWDSYTTKHAVTSHLSEQWPYAFLVSPSLEGINSRFMSLGMRGASPCGADGSPF
jgi:hypothetical protein